MKQRTTRFFICLSLILPAVAASPVMAQYAKPPDAYSISYTESFMMPNQQVKIYRDGNQVVTEEFTPRSGQMQKPTHTRDYINLETHKQWTLDLQDPSVPCGVSTLGGSPGDWSGNPFEWLSGFFDIDPSKMHLPEVGTDTIAGMKATIFQMAGPGGQKAKIWVDDQYGVPLKMEMPGKNGATETILEVKSLAIGKPAASIFARPAGCAAPARASAASASGTAAAGGGSGEIQVPKGVQFEMKWDDGSPLNVKPQEEVAFILISDISNLQNIPCQLNLNRFCSLAELVKGVKTDSRVEGLTVDPAQDKDYHFNLTITGETFQVAAVPTRPALGGWLYVKQEFGSDCYFNPHGPATTKDKKIGDFSVFGGNFER